MAITYVASAKGPGTFPGSSNNTSSCVIAKPAGTVNGDLMIAVIQAGATTISAPAGWTLRDEYNHSTANLTNCIFTRVAASEGSNYTFTDSSGSTTPLCGAIVTYRGCDNSNPINVIQDSETGGTDTVSTPSATTTGSGVCHMLHIRVGKTSTVSTQGTFAAVTNYSDRTTFANRGASTQYFVEVLSRTDMQTVSSGSQAGISFNADHSLTGSIERQVGINVLADPADGDLGATLPAVTSSFAATREIPAGTMAASLAPVAADASGVAAPPEGPLATSLAPVSASLTGETVSGSVSTSLAPVSAALSGSVIPSGALAGSLAPITVLFGTETQPFGEHVIVVEAEDRAFSVIDDDPGLKPIARSAVWEPFIPHVFVDAGVAYASAAGRAPTVKLPTYAFAGVVLAGAGAPGPTVSTATVTNASAGSASVSASLSAAAKTLSPRPANVLAGGVAYSPTVSTSNIRNAPAGVAMVSATAQDPGNVNGARAGAILTGAGVYPATVPTIAHAGTATVTSVTRGVATDSVLFEGVFAHVYSPSVQTT